MNRFLIPIGWGRKITAEVRPSQPRHRAHGHELIRPIVEPPTKEQHQCETVSNREDFDRSSPRRGKGGPKIGFPQMSTEPSAQFLGTVPGDQEAPTLSQYSHVLFRRNGFRLRERIPASTQGLDQQRLQLHDTMMTGRMV